MSTFDDRVKERAYYLWLNGQEGTAEEIYWLAEEQQEYSERPKFSIPNALVRYHNYFMKNWKKMEDDRTVDWMEMISRAERGEPYINLRFPKEDQS